jgi:hypothetical protein
MAHIPEAPLRGCVPRRWVRVSREAVTCRECVECEGGGRWETIIEIQNGQQDRVTHLVD